MVQGCVCDDGYEGYDCSERSCPKGSDPLSQGTIETQTVRSAATHANEVQRIDLSGTGGSQADEVQVFHVYAASGNAVGGSFRLRFNTLAVGGIPTCALCSTEADCTTADISVGATPATTAGSVKAALEACANVGSTQITVTGSSHSDAS